MVKGYEYLNDLFVETLKKVNTNISTKHFDALLELFNAVNKRIRKTAIELGNLRKEVQSDRTSNNNLYATLHQRLLELEHGELKELKVKQLSDNATIHQRLLELERESLKELEVKCLSDNATLPTRNHSTDAGLDIYAAESVILKPQEKRVLKTDIAVNIPPGYVGLLTSRSGVSSKSEIVIETGKIDSGYNGELGLNIRNSSVYEREKIYGYFDVKGEFISKTTTYPLKSYQINKGDKIAQLLIVPIETPKPLEVDDFKTESDRGDKGFGSSGY